jgi:thiamine biosynthesis protein ThiS
LCQFGAVRSVVRAARPDAPVNITLNGERYELDRPLSVTDLLARLAIDPRRVAIEHNLAIIRRHTYSDVLVRDGDTVEIVNFVGGG